MYKMLRFVNGNLQDSVESEDYNYLREVMSKESMEVVNSNKKSWSGLVLDKADLVAFSGNSEYRWRIQSVV